MPDTSVEPNSTMHSSSLSIRQHPVCKATILSSYCLIALRPFKFPHHICRKARSAARRAHDEANALKQEAAELRKKADELLQNLRAAEDDVSAYLHLQPVSLTAAACLVSFW